MPDSRPPARAGSNDMILGEIRGQQREMVHVMNNLSQKMDALSREVIGLGPLAADVAEVKVRIGTLEREAAAAAEVAALEVKVNALETERNRREGASGLLLAILRSPALGWLTGAAITAWAILTGKVDV